MGVIIKCTLPNASEHISGVVFSRQADGVLLSEEVEADIAERFTRIKGYELYSPKADPARDKILAEADSLGIKLDKRLNTDRLAAALAEAKAKLPPPAPAAPEGAPAPRPVEAPQA